MFCLRFLQRPEANALEVSDVAKEDVFHARKEESVGPDHQTCGGGAVWRNEASAVAPFRSFRSVRSLTVFERPVQLKS